MSVYGVFFYSLLLIVCPGLLESRDLDGVITNDRTVGVIVNDSVRENVWSTIPVVSANLQDGCNSRVVLENSSIETDINKVTENLWLFDAGIVTMTGCDFTFFVSEAAESLGVQHIAIPPSHCPVGFQHYSTTHFLTAKPGFIYKALQPLLQYVRGNRMHIIHDSTVSKDQDLQEFVVDVSKIGIHVAIHKLTAQFEIIETLWKMLNVFNDDTDFNIVTFLGQDNLKDLLQQAADRNITWYLCRWVICGEPGQITDLDLAPWVKTNFVIVSPRLPHLDRTSGYFSNINNQSQFHCNKEASEELLQIQWEAKGTYQIILQIFIDLTLACFLAVELSYPGVLNSTHWLPLYGCKPPILSTFESLQKQAAWIAYNKDHVFGVDGYRQDIVIDVWGLTNSSKPQPPSSSRLPEVAPTVRATWSLDEGMTFLEPRIFPYTFSDFGGDFFQIALYEAQPFIIKHEDENGTVTYDGLCISMLKEIAKRLHFSYELIEPPDRVYGSPVNKAKTKWNGMIGMVVNKEVPFAIGPFTVSEDRSRVVDFTVPFMQDMGGIAVRRPQATDSSAFQIWRPFSPRVWAAIIVGIFIFGILLFLVDKVTSCVSKENVAENRPLSLVSYIWNIFGEYLEQSTDYRPNPASARCLVVVWWLFAIVMSSTYTANLAALYTVVSEHKHINSISELADSPTVQPLLQPGSFLNNMFSEARPGTLYYRVAQRLSSYPVMPVRSSDALRMVAKSDHFAFMSDHSQLEYSASKTCRHLVMAEERFGTPWSFAFPVPKNAPYLPALNQIILKFQESGLMDRWHQRWWSSSSACSPVANKRPASIELPQFMGPFLMVLIAFGATLCVLAVELCIDRAYKSRPKRPLTVFNG